MNYQMKLIVAVILGTAIFSFATDAPADSLVCRQGETVFRGQCIVPRECCRENLCEHGEVFEFGKDGPGCVPCAEAEGQQSMNFCAAEAMIAADHELDVERKAFLKRFPERVALLAAVEEAWRTFRDRRCGLEGSEYEGGSMHALIVGDCRAQEARSHRIWLKALRADWSKH